VHASGEQEYVDALHRVWHNVVHKNMYVTGGIGPSHDNEGFTHDYDLPNETAYCETCASIGMVMWNQRMNLLFRDAKYADVMERAMYNGALAGLSFEGDKFFYVNPLASRGDHHRVAWFDVSCCPTNLARFLPSIGNYMFAAAEGGFAVNLYASCEADIPLSGGNRVRADMQTDYPWDASIDIALHPERQERFPVILRIPGWCRSYEVLVNGERQSAKQAPYAQGYIVLDREWKQGDRIALTLDMEARWVRSRPEVAANVGRLALQRGPLVYCMEQADHPGIEYDEAAFAPDAAFVVEHRADWFHGISVLSGPDSRGRHCTFVPYYAWDNREPGYMQVWVKEHESEQLYLG